MHSKTQTTPVRVGLVSLGCAKNLVDAEIMLGALLKNGIEITNDASQADALIVNTCSFIDSAQEESVDAIIESAQERDRARPHQGLIVSGCMPQRFREELPKLLPEVDAFMGIDQVAQVAELVRKAIALRKAKLESAAPGARARVARRAGQVKSQVAALDRARPDAHHDALRHDPAADKDAKAKAGQAIETPAAGPSVDVHQRPTYIPDYNTPRFRLTPKHFAYVKIAEGCNHPCSFCIIPRMRGSHRSRQQKDIVREAKNLIAEGVRELNLISQDSTYYGLDLRPNHSRAISSPEKFTAAARSLAANATTLSSLLQELNGLKGDFWIRLLYTHPAHWTDELIQTMAECQKVARYIDMPLQHIHDAMLERMRRETSSEYIERLIQRIRAGIPGVAIRTTFIVGFPGETEAYFQRLLEFMETTRFERLGVFTYSREDGTRAGSMEQQVADRAKLKRRERAMALQHRISRELCEARVGHELRVLVEGVATAETLKQARVSSWEHGAIRQETDSGNQLSGNYWVARGEADAPDIDGRVYIKGRLTPGDFARVKIVGHTDYDLVARPS
ncbi:MAG: MiaB/RimO family radical SAM methylthiotransferase [Verrucomicrobia bacterium]|nr:MiaB/RimO family radical SAM methylthiotransferase [Verrucomicrobiota bacterium]MBI3868088.1 MiaB/RimO family radical SAM methylthiotransferase [Verrucomicrobiota bacterium]